MDLGSLAVVNSKFSRNRAYGKGGALWIGRGKAFIVHSHFYGNFAAQGGGALWIGSTIHADINQCNFWGNRGMSETSNGDALFHEELISSTGKITQYTSALLGWQKHGRALIKNVFLFIFII